MTMRERKVVTWLARDLHAGWAKQAVEVELSLFAPVSCMLKLCTCFVAVAASCTTFRHLRGAYGKGGGTEVLCARRGSYLVSYWTGFNEGLL